MKEKNFRSSQRIAYVLDLSGFQNKNPRFRATETVLDSVSIFITGKIKDGLKISM